MKFYSLMQINSAASRLGTRLGREAARDFQNTLLTEEMVKGIPEYLRGKIELMMAGNWRYKPLRVEVSPPFFLCRGSEPVMIWVETACGDEPARRIFTIILNPVREDFTQPPG